jgi:RNA polymerase sigma-70 factor (ECF subfamily)
VNGTTVLATDAIIDQYLDTAYQLAWWSCRNPHHAEEAVYEAARLARRRPRPGPGEHDGRVWFLAIVREVLADRHGLDGVSSPGDAWGLYSQCDVGGAPEDPCDDDGLTVEEAIRRLPYTLRQVLVLRDVEGLSYRDLANILDVTTETIAVCLSRARQQLSRAFGSERSVAPRSAHSEARMAACCGEK